MNDNPPPIEQRYEAPSNAKLFTLTSFEFKDNSEIGRNYTCEGTNTAPTLQWRDAPAGTKSFALIVDDPDAPTARPWVHWVVANIPGSFKELGRLERNEKSDSGIIQGINSFNRVGFDGPCPPPGKSHRYYFTLYALQRKLELPETITKEILLQAMEGKILEKAVLMGTYHRFKNNMPRGSTASVPSAP